MDQEMVRKREELKQAYNRIPKTKRHDARRLKAFDELMAFEAEMLEDANNE